MPDRISFARRYIDTLGAVLRELPVEGLAETLRVLERAHLDRRYVFIAGNGGSAATASHMANDLQWGLARLGTPGLRAIALSDNVPLLTAIANDRSYEDVFAAQLESLADAGDVLIVI